MTVKTTIDIEDLVRWTYQVQRADLIVGLGVGLYEGEAYRAWRGVLVALLSVFVANRDRLCAHTVTGPAALAAPWNGRQTQEAQNPRNRCSLYERSGL